MIREQTTIRLPSELKEQLEKEAQRRGDSFNGLINSVLYDFINRTQELRHDPLRSP